MPGDWDQRTAPQDGYPSIFSERSYYSAAKLHFEDGIDLAEIDSSYSGISSTMDHRRMCTNVQHIGNLMDMIRESGYLTQAELVRLQS